jgi:hypothetical protein
VEKGVEEPPQAVSAAAAAHNVVISLRALKRDIIDPIQIEGFE